MPYLLFLKKRQICNCRLLQIIGGAFRVKHFFFSCPSVLGSKHHNNIITGNWKSNTITGGEFSDTINGKGGNDVLRGEEGDDFLDGGDGRSYSSTIGIYGY